MRVLAEQPSRMDLEEPLQSQTTGLLYASECVMVSRLCNSHWEVVTWPHDEVDDEGGCASLIEGLRRIGEWAEFVIPEEVVEDALTGTTTFVLSN